MLRASRHLHNKTQFHFGHPPLSKLFPKSSGVPIAPRPAAPPAAVKVTTTNTGTKIISQDNGGAHSALGVFIEAGAKFDPLASPGMSYVMRWGLTTSNMENSLFQIDRTMRSAAFAYGTTEINKRFIGLKIEGRRDLWQAPLQELLIGVSAPRFAEPDLERMRDTWDNLFEEERWQRPRVHVEDMVETVAFLKQPLGSPRQVLPLTNDKSYSASLQAQWASLCLPTSIVIAGVNVEHDALIASFDNNPYPLSAQAPHHARATKTKITQGEEAAQYSGGCRYEIESRAKAMGTRPDMREDVAVAIAWLSNGAETTVQQYAATLVAEQALRESATVSHFTEMGLSPFYRPYSTAGLLGFSFVGEPDAATDALKTAANAFVKPFNVDSAKARALMSFHIRHIEAARDYVDFLATSKFSESDIIAAIQAVQQKDVKQVLDSARASQPSIYGTGYTYGLPSVRQLQL